MKRRYWPEGSLGFEPETMVFLCPHCRRAAWNAAVSVVVVPFGRADWHFACPFKGCASILERFKESAE